MEKMIPDGGDRVHDLILRSLREREALWRVLIASYRVELTTLLDRAAKSGFEAGDNDAVLKLAEHIAAAAKAAQLSAIRGDAISLRACARIAQSDSERGEGKVLAAGLKLVDRILGEAHERENGKKGAQLLS